MLKFDYAKISTSTVLLGIVIGIKVMCDMLCMLGETAVRGLIDCIFNLRLKHQIFLFINVSF